VDIQDGAQLAADCLVIRADPAAQAANPFYFHRLTAALGAVAALAESSPDDPIRESARCLIDAPADPAAYHGFREAVVAAADRCPAAAARMVEAAAAAMSSSRIGYRLGEKYRLHEPVTIADLATPVETGRPAGDDPQVLVVVPFRDRTAQAARARNLLACLRALRDQSLDRGRYRVCVVESDSEPRWWKTLAPFVDDYVFAEKSGVFNKSWAVNVGVTSAATGACLLCILDADALVDRDFLARNVARFARPGTGAFLPFRDLSYLDPAASGRAIAVRCLHGQPDAPAAELRSFVVFRSPGVCVWLRRDVFTDVHGMDERYEDWGGEDMAFVMRLNLATPFLVFDDAMYHLYHESAGHLVNGQTVNANISWLDWHPEHPIGDPARFVGRREC
jgi:hypothetical protein